MARIGLTLTKIMVVLHPSREVGSIDEPDRPDVATRWSSDGLPGGGLRLRCLDSAERRGLSRAGSNPRRAKSALRWPSGLHHAGCDPVVPQTDREDDAKRASDQILRSVEEEDDEGLTMQRPDCLACILGSGKVDVRRLQRCTRTGIDDVGAGSQR